jgi:hypothetical protein
METIAEKLGPEGAGLVAGLMDQNRRDQEWVDNAVRGSLERDRDEWKARALAAEDELVSIRRRVLAFVFGEERFDA